MSSSFIIFLTFLVLCSASIIPNKRIDVKSRENSNDIGTPCSTNISNLWINIFLFIDVSTNMGADNLKRVTLSFASELSTVPIGTVNTPNTARVIIITYADTATVIADIYKLNSNNDVTNALLSLKPSNSSSAAGMVDAFNQAENMLNNYYSNVTDGIFRQNAFVFIGASSTGVDSNQLWWIAANEKFDLDSIITINYNSQDAQLATIFNNISSLSFNFSSSNKNLYSDFSWALTQTNCYCGLGEIEQLYFFNTNKSRWERYADCYMEVGFEGFQFHNPSDFCTNIVNGSVLAAITSLEKHVFLEYNVFSETNSYYYIGLHRNSQNNWVWYDYDGSEFPLGSYAPWATGYNANSPGGCVSSTNQSSSSLVNPVMQWTPTSCNINDLQADIAFMCQVLACDADGDSCLNLIPGAPTQSPAAKSYRTRNSRNKQRKSKRNHKVGHLKKSRKNSRFMLNSH